MSENDPLQAVMTDLLRPYWLAVLPVALSFIIWAVPWSENVHRGYDRKEPLDLATLGFLALWYGVVVAAAYAGFRLGLRFRPLSRVDDFPHERYYRYFTALAFVGVAFSYAIVEYRHPGIF